MLDQTTSSQPFNQIELSDTKRRLNQDYDEQRSPFQDSTQVFSAPRDPKEEKDTIELFSEFISNPIRAEKNSTLKRKKTQQQKQELLKATSKLFGERDDEIDPCRGIEHVSQVHFQDQLKDQISPFDTHQIVQTLQIPSAEKQGLFLTVQLVNQNVLAEGLVLKDPSQPNKRSLLCKCGLRPILVSEEEPSQQNSKGKSGDKCHFCEEQFQTLYRCQNKQESMFQDETEGCDLKVCQRCFANNFVKFVQRNKLKNHAVWQSYSLEKKSQKHLDEVVEQYGGIKKDPQRETKEIECATIAVVGAWQRNGKSPAICVKQYQVIEPFFFPKGGKKSLLDLDFIHTGQKGELFFLQKARGQIFYNQIVDSFEADIFDKKECIHSSDLYDLPLSAQRVLVKVDLRAFQDPRPECAYYARIMKQPLRLAGEYLIFSSRVVDGDSDAKLKQFQDEISTSLYNLKSGKETVVRNAVLILQVKTDKNSAGVYEITYLARQEFQIKILKVLWSELEIAQSSSTDQITYTSPKAHQEWLVVKPELDDLFDFCREDMMLHGTIHTKGTRCTILSLGKMKWITYCLKTFDEKGAKTLKEIVDSHKMQGKSFAFYHDKPTDRFLIVQGLQKVPETTEDSLYQKFEILCLDQSQSQGELEAADEEEELKQEPFITFKRNSVRFGGLLTSSIRISEHAQILPAFLPVELLSNNNEISNHMLRLISISTDNLGKVQLSSFVQVAPIQALGSINGASKFVYLTNMVEKPENSAQNDSKIGAFVPTVAYNKEIEANFGFILPSQEHHIEYPILLQTTYHPKRNQILISNLTLNLPKVLLFLGSYRFVCFVRSSLVDEYLESNSTNHHEQTNLHAVRLDSGHIRVHILVCKEHDPKRFLRLMWFEVSIIDELEDIREIGTENPAFHAGKASSKQKIETKSYRQLNYGIYKEKIDLPQVGSFEQIKRVVIFRAQKNQSLQLDICLVVQTVDRVFPYVLFDKVINKKVVENSESSRSIQTVGKVLPVPMVCGPDFSCFYVVADKQGFKIYAMYSETFNTERIRIDPIVTLEERIVQIQVHQDYKNKSTVRLVVLDVAGRVKIYELVKSYGIYVVEKTVKSFYIPKKRFQKVESIIKNSSWTEFILQEASFIMLKEDGQNFLFQPFKEFLSWDILEATNKFEGERLSISAFQIPWIEKHCFVTQVGSYSSIQVKPNVDSTKIDFNSQKLNSQVKGIHILGQNVVIELMTRAPDASLYVSYNSSDMMLGYVNFHQNTKILSGPNSKGNYYAQMGHINSADKLNDLFIYQENGKWKRKFSYVDWLEETMMDCLNSQIGQKRDSSTNEWHFSPISQSSGIAKESGNKIGPLFQDDETMAMVYFMSQTSVKDNSLKRLATVEFQQVEHSITKLVSNLVDKEKVQKNVLNFSENKDSDATRIFKITVRQDLPPLLKPKSASAYHHSYFVTNKSSKNSEEQFDCYIIQTSRHVKAKTIFSKNYLIWVTETGRLYFAKLEDIEQNQELSQQDFNSSELQSAANGQRQKQILKRLVSSGSVKPTKFETIDLKQIVTNFQFQDFSLLVLTNMDRLFHLKDGKDRQDIIQFQFNGVSLVWDLGENEEITYLFGADNQYDVKNFVRTGHLLRFTKQSTSGMPAELACFRPNKDQTLFVCQAISAEAHEQNVIHCFRLYTQRDIQEISAINCHLRENNLSLLNFNPNLFIANIMNRTFFDLYGQNHQVINQAFDCLRDLELDTFQDEENDFEQRFDNIYLRKLYQTMLCPVSRGASWAQKKQVDTIFRRQSTRLLESDESIDYFQKNILQKVLHEYPILLNDLLRIVLISNEVRLSNLVTTLPSFLKLFQSQSQERNHFIEKAVFQTNATRKITGLEAGRKQRFMFFGSNTTMLGEKQIRQKFAEKCKCKEEEKELYEFKIVIMEAEWLTDVGEFYIALQNADPLVFENNVIQFLIKQLHFKYRVIWLMFVPFIVYMVMTLYYYCVFVTNESQFHLGFFGGKPFSATLRVIISLFTGYFWFVELMQVKQTGLKYFKDKKNYPNHVIYLANLFVILDHSTDFIGLQPILIAQIASVVVILLWANLYYWMRLFTSTAMYVDMINQTMYDVRHFAVLVFIEIAAFGNALMILNYIQFRHQTEIELITEEYQPIYQKAFGAPLIDAIISQYTLGLGNFYTDNFKDSPSLVLCWIYFLLATFFTQILFINMIIAMMSTTYDNVREKADRNALIMQTKILSDLILFAPRKSKFKDQRYLYIAERVQEEVQSSFDSIQLMKHMDTHIKEGFENSKQLVGEMRMQQIQIIDQLSTLQKEQQHSERQWLTLMQKIEGFISKQTEEASARDNNISELQTKFQQLKNEVYEQSNILVKSQVELNVNMNQFLNTVNANRNQAEQ